MNLLERVRFWLRATTVVGLALIPLGLVVAVLFGEATEFITGDIIANLIGLIGTLAKGGLIGIATVVVLVWLFGPAFRKYSNGPKKNKDYPGAK